MPEIDIVVESRSTGGKVPAWIMREVAKWRRALGLEYWGISVKMGRKLKVRGVRAVASATRNRQVVAAVLEFDKSLVDSRWGRETVGHEVLHIAHDDIDYTVGRIINRLPKRERAAAGAEYEMEMERFIELLARALCPVLEMVQPSGMDALNGVPLEYPQRDPDTLAPCSPAEENNERPATEG